MIDIKLVRDNPDVVRRSQQARGEDPAIIDAIRHSASWRCFQCGMVLTTEHDARNHFGDTACVSVQHERERQCLRAALAETRRVLRRFATVTQERGVILPSDLVSDVRAVLAQM